MQGLGLNVGNLVGECDESREELSVVECERGRDAASSGGPAASGAGAGGGRSAMATSWDSSDSCLVTNAAFSWSSPYSRNMHACKHKGLNILT